MATQDSDEREKLIDKLMEREGFKSYGVQRYCVGKHTQPCGCYFANQREHYGNLADFIIQDHQAAIDKAVAETEKKLKEEESSHEGTVEDRDWAEEWADKLAYEIERVFKISIGEHSNVNNPWVNAYEYLRDLPVTVDVRERPKEAA